MIDLWGPDLIRAGFSGYELKILFPLIELADKVGTYYTVGTEYFDSGEAIIENAEIPASDDNDASVIDSDVLLAEIKQLKKQNKELKEALHVAQKDVSQGLEEIASLKGKSSSEKEELEKLRELLLNSTEDVQKENTVTIDFPYHTKHNIVVFGGHDTWLKTIKNMLPDVKFIERSQYHFPESIVFGADMVFIQSNSIPHSFYYKIMGIVRSHKIPFYYFGNASAEKCAKYLAITDSQAESTAESEERSE